MNNTTCPPAERSHFVTTRWTQVVAARATSSGDAPEALESLCRAYWRPLYYWVRRQGRSPQDAQDLTQEFFARLLEKDWLRNADPALGRFRTFLLVALKRFLADDWDRSRAQKRGGNWRRTEFDLDAAEQQFTEHPAEGPADHVFDRQWATTLLDRAIGRLRQEYETAQRAHEFAVLKGFLSAGRGEIAYREVAERLPSSEGAARVAVHRLRKRFRELFREEVSATVAAGESVDDEVRQLLAALARSMP
jgi:RNA polymerase sigma factor (sigma-70 family)